MAALQLAERGFFCKEMNAGWAEWAAADLPTHSSEVPPGKIRCDCAG